IIAIRVAGSNGPSADWGPTPGDVRIALQRAFELRNDFAITAVNFSSGIDYYPDQQSCEADYPLTKQAIDTLRDVGIATVIASGNEKHTDGVSAPACISSAVSLAATTKSDTIWDEPS